MIIRYYRFNESSMTLSTDEVDTERVSYSIGHAVTMPLVIGFVLLLMLWSPAWAGHAMDPVVDSWSASPTPQGGTVYSNGLDRVETYRSGPSSSTYYGWDRNGRQTMGTVYQTVPRAQPSESLSDWAQRTLPSSRSTTERRR